MKKCHFCKQKNIPVDSNAFYHGRKICSGCWATKKSRRIFRAPPHLKMKTNSKEAKDELS